MPDFSFDEAKELCLQALDKGERVVEITGPVMVHYCEFSELQPGRFVEIADYGTARVLEIHSDEPLNLRNILDEPVDLG